MTWTLNLNPTDFIGQHTQWSLIFDPRARTVYAHQGDSTPGCVWRGPARQVRVDGTPDHDALRELLSEIDIDGDWCGYDLAHRIAHCDQILIGDSDDWEDLCFDPVDDIIASLVAGDDLDDIIEWLLDAIELSHYSRVDDIAALRDRVGAFVRSIPLDECRTAAEVEALETFKAVEVTDVDDQIAEQLAPSRPSTALAAFTPNRVERFGDLDLTDDTGRPTQQWASGRAAALAVDHAPLRAGSGATRLLEALPCT